MEWDSSLPVNEDTLVSLGILTTDRIRKYPLKYANLQVVLKVYAVITYQPFEYYTYGHKDEVTPYFMTDHGIAWLYGFFKDKDLQYARSLFGALFAKATEDTLKHLDTYPYFGNFRGTSGVKRKMGTVQPALIIRTVGRTERKYEFNSIAEARDQLNVWLCLYPPEQFALYRIRTDRNGYKFKERLKLVIVSKGYENLHRNDK